MHTLADFAGAGTTVAVSATRVSASWVQFVVSGTGPARIGDSTVTVSIGLPVLTGQGQMLPPRRSPTIRFYNLALLYMYIPVGTTVSVAYGD